MSPFLQQDATCLVQLLRLPINQLATAEHSRVQHRNFCFSGRAGNLERKVELFFLSRCHASWPSLITHPLTLSARDHPRKSNISLCVFQCVKPVTRIYSDTIYLKYSTDNRIQCRPNSDMTCVIFDNFRWKGTAVGAWPEL